VRAMEAASALADLREIAPQLRVVVLLDADGEPIASSAVEPGAFAAAVRELLGEAAALRPGGGRAVERVHVVTAAGSVFAVSSGGRTLAAVAPPDAAPALVFHDLRTSLAGFAPQTADAET
jgi:DNA-binding NarL/FixJ family response regulator